MAQNGMKKPTAVIFDFGGVLLNLDLKKTLLAFESLGIPHFEDLFNLYKSTALFDDLEIGKVTPAQFMDNLRRETELELSDDQITEAWNALLMDFRTESLHFVARLKTQIPAYLYSNTNIIHYECFQERIREVTPFSHLNELFHRAYYSHEIGMRKPHPEGFLHIIQENALDASSTLFVDDNADNIKGAKSVGLLTHHLQPDERVEQVLSWLVNQDMPC